MVKYVNLGAQKKLNEVVMAGSHDAAITKGKANAQTQNLNILDQASAGVRIFDIRITGATVQDGFKQRLELKAYHGQGPTMNRTLKDARTGAKETMKVKSMTAGTYGMSLTKILTEARTFVERNGSEFVILKFDKCHNWQQIAEACEDILGDTICTKRGLLNQKTLAQLAGQVIVLFSTAGHAAVTWADPAGRGILKFQNLEDGVSAYDPNFDGIQYFGKGGTKVKKIFSDHKKKMKENFDKQVGMIQQGAATDPRVLGMIYWTATGVAESIKSRNSFLWNDENQDKMIEMWATRVPAAANIAAPHAAPLLKRFMPNFVMIDFASPDRCKKIYDLNGLSQHAMSAKVRDYFGIDS